MRFASPLLYGVARGVGVASLDGSEQDLAIPHVLLPLVRVPGAMPRIAGFSVTDIQRDSFAAAARTGRAASQAAITEVICTFGRGLWRIVVNVFYTASWTATPDGTPGQGAMVLQDPVPSNRTIMAFMPIATVQQRASATFEWLFIEDSWALAQTINATGVGQQNEINSQVIASRLL